MFYVEVCLYIASQSHCACKICIVLLAMSNACSALNFMQPNYLHLAVLLQLLQSLQATYDIFIHCYSFTAHLTGLNKTLTFPYFIKASSIVPLDTIAIVIATYMCFSGLHLQHNYTICT